MSPAPASPRLARAAAAGMEITEGSPLVGRTLQQLGGPAVPLLVRHADGQLIANPTGELQLQAGDALVVSGEASGLNPLDRE